MDAKSVFSSKEESVRLSTDLSSDLTSLEDSEDAFDLNDWHREIGVSDMRFPPFFYIPIQLCLTNYYYVSRFGVPSREGCLEPLCICHGEDAHAEGMCSLFVN